MSVFRSASMCSYVREHVLRFSLSQLDVACQDSRFPSEAFVELIFAPVVAENPTPTSTPLPAVEVEGVVVVPTAHVTEFQDAIDAESKCWDELDRWKVGGWGGSHLVNRSLCARLLSSPPPPPVAVRTVGSCTVVIHP